MLWHFVSIVLGARNYQTGNAVQLCSKVTSLRQFSHKILEISIFLFRKTSTLIRFTHFMFTVLHQMKLFKRFAGKNIFIFTFYGRVSVSYYGNVALFWFRHQGERFVADEKDHLALLEDPHYFKNGSGLQWAPFFLAQKILDERSIGHAPSSDESWSSTQQLKQWMINRLKMLHFPRVRWIGQALERYIIYSAFFSVIKKPATALINSWMFPKFRASRKNFYFGLFKVLR